MSNLIDTGLIRIKKLPAGEAPENIRKEWIGSTLPCNPIVGFSEEEFGALSNKKGSNRYAFNVPQKEALEILEKASRVAAKYWKSKGYPKPGNYFVFDESEAEIISGVTFQRIHVINDLDHPHGIGVNCNGCGKGI